jgi:hypothetical protein
MFADGCMCHCTNTQLANVGLCFQTKGEHHNAIDGLLQSLEMLKKEGASKKEGAWKGGQNTFISPGNSLADSKMEVMYALGFSYYELSLYEPAIFWFSEVFHTHQFHMASISMELYCSKHLFINYQFDVCLGVIVHHWRILYLRRLRSHRQKMIK